MKTAVAWIVLVVVLAVTGGCAQGDTGQRTIATTGLVVFIGDSITHAWPLQRYLSGTVNAGVIGNSTPAMLQRFEADVIARRPSFVVILGGTNDIRLYESADLGSLLSMVERATSAGIKVIVGTVPPASNVGANAALKQAMYASFNEGIRTAASQYGFSVVDYHAALVGPDGRADERFFSDGLHPNDQGFAAMWGALHPVLLRVGAVLE